MKKIGNVVRGVARWVGDAFSKVQDSPEIYDPPMSERELLEIERALGSGPEAGVAALLREVRRARGAERRLRDGMQWYVNRIGELERQLFRRMP